MSTTSKHIFLQVNTEAIALLNAEYHGDIPDASVLAQTILYEQGSLALGGPIRDMTIDVEPGQELYFTILPLTLYGYNKVYFNDFIQDATTSIITKLPQFDSHILSFSISIDETAPVGAEERFDMMAVVEVYQSDDNPVKIQIKIDPVLRVIQRRQK
jgi:hypothetical protein